MAEEKQEVKEEVEQAEDENQNSKDLGDTKNKGNLENEKIDNSSENESTQTEEPSQDVVEDTNKEGGDKTASGSEPTSKDSEDKPKKETKKKEKQDRTGILNIYTTFNNTVMNLTDMSGKSIAKFSGGQSTKQDRLKANPTIAMFISQRIAEEARDNGITSFYVKVRAKTGQANPGPGTHAAIKSLTRAGFKILSIMDTTRIPRGGPKKKHGRRGRRV